MYYGAKNSWIGKMPTIFTFFQILNLSYLKSLWKIVKISGRKNSENFKMLSFHFLSFISIICFLPGSKILYYCVPHSRKKIADMNCLSKNSNVWKNVSLNKMETKKTDSLITVLKDRQKVVPSVWTPLLKIWMRSTKLLGCLISI